MRKDMETLAKAEAIRESVFNKAPHLAKQLVPNFLSEQAAKRRPRLVSVVASESDKNISLSNENEAVDIAPIKATISRIVLETHDTKSYFFKTDSPLAHHKAGTHITIQFSEDGKETTRTYTLSSAPSMEFQKDLENASSNEYSITVKRINDGFASNWLFTQLKEGDQINVSQAQGQFVLPYQPAGKLLFLSAGSGITPMMSMLRYLSKSGNQSDIVFLNYSRSEQDIIFRKELIQLTGDSQSLSTLFVTEQDKNGVKQDRINARQLAALVPDLAEREIYMCGPQPFMKASMTIFDQLDVLPTRIHMENFSADLSAATALNYSAQLKFSSLEHGIASSASKTILQEAEAAGLNPSSACRTGICRTCRCKKLSGTTVNLATGEESTKDNEYILPCVSVAKTETHIEL
jgi:ferredoxin-NADP reductase